MSLNQLRQNSVKPWLDVRVNDLIADGYISTGTGVPIDSNGSMSFAGSTINGAGGTNAVNLNYVYQRVRTSAGTASLTFAPGRAGQLMIVSLDVAGNTCTIPAAQIAGSLTYVMSIVGQSVQLMYNSTAGWSVIGMTPGVSAS